MSGTAASSTPSEGVLFDVETRRSLTAAIAAISTTGFALAMGYPLFAVLLERMGASGWEMGLNAAAPAVAMLLVAPLLPAVLRWIPLPLLLALSSALMAGAFLGFRVWEGIWSWALLRFVMGVAGVAAFWGSELWIVTAAPPGRRGLMIGVYGVCLSLGFVVGPLVLQLVDVGGWAPFAIGAALSLAAIGPVIWAWRAAPRGLGGPRQPLTGALDFFRSDPSVLFAVMLFGAVEFGGFALLPAWAVGVGLSEGVAIATVAWVAFGNVLLQLPLGWAADRVSRRGLLALSALSVILGCGWLAGEAAGGWRMAAVLTGLGGLAVALYTVSLVELGARYSGEALARGTGAFMSAYGFGALAAPPLFGASMDLFGPNGLLGAMAALAAGYLALAAARARRAVDSRAASGM